MFVPLRETSFHALLEIDPLMLLAGWLTFPTMTTPNRNRFGERVTKPLFTLSPGLDPAVYAFDQVPHHTGPSNGLEGSEEEDRTMTHCTGNPSAVKNAIPMLVEHMAEG